MNNIQMVNSSCQWEIQHITSQIFLLRILARPSLIFWWGNQGGYYQAYLKAILHRSIFIKPVRPISISRYTGATTDTVSRQLKRETCIFKRWESNDKAWKRITLDWCALGTTDKLKPLPIKYQNTLVLLTNISSSFGIIAPHYDYCNMTLDNKRKTMLKTLYFSWFFPKGILLDTSYKISNVWRLFFFFYKSLIILLILKSMFKVHIFSVGREDRREK